MGNCTKCRIGTRTRVQEDLLKQAADVMSLARIEITGQGGQGEWQKMLDERLKEVGGLCRELGSRQEPGEQDDPSRMNQYKLNALIGVADNIKRRSARMYWGVSNLERDVRAYCRNSGGGMSDSAVYALDLVMFIREAMMELHDTLANAEAVMLKQKERNNAGTDSGDTAERVRCHTADSAE